MWPLLFDPDFCNVTSGWEKGVVEKSVQDRRRQIWAEIADQHWTSLTQLNDWLAQRCRQSRETGNDGAPDCLWSKTLGSR